jgi:alditol oxidase
VGPVTVRNWAGNVTYGAARLHRPTSVEQVQEVVAGCRRIRALGSGHSFSRVADTDGDLVTLAGLPARFEIADDRQSVTVSGGLRYGEVAPRLHAAGRALSNLGSLPHICVAGAVATGTHGSGDSLGCLATAVLGLDLVTASGDLLHLDRSDRRFPGAVVALGGLGIVTAVTLAVEPAYDVAQQVVADVTPGMARNNLDEVFAAGDSVSAFATWGHGDPVRLWVKRRTDGEWPPLDGDWLGGRPASRAQHPVPGLDPAACTEQLGHRGPWHERLPHFRLDHTPSHGDELQTEYLVPREHAVDALDAVAGVAERIAPVLMVSELRTVAGDDLWLSPAYGRDSLAVHFTWRADPDAVMPVVTALETALAPFDVRPHWGKVFTTDADAVAALYPRHEDARALRRDLDPDDVFGNTFLDSHLPR